MPHRGAGSVVSASAVGNVTGSGAGAVTENGELPATINLSIKEIKMAMEAFNMQHKSAKTQEEAMQKAYQFWSTQPVPKMGWFNVHSFICFVFFVFLVVRLT